MSKAIFIAMIPFLVADIYLLFLTLSAIFYRHRQRQVEYLPRMAVLIPAHNEEVLITKCLDSLAKLDYPNFRVYIVADNCNDRTIELATQHGFGQLTVWERNDAYKRGKGYALDWGFQQLILSDDPFDAVVLLDADTMISSQFLKEMAHGLQVGWHVQQGDYRIDLSEGSWRRRIAFISSSLYMHIRSLGRDRVGLSSGLFGNGICLSRQIVKEIGWPAFSIVEDSEYRAILAIRGIRVRYQPSAQLWAHAPVKLAESNTQRQRWVNGRYQLIRHYVPKLIKAAVQRRDIMPIGVVTDILLPSFSLQWGAMCAFGVLGIIWGGGWFWRYWCIGVFSLMVYIIVGLLIAKVPWRVWLSLFGAPYFLGWALMLDIKQLWCGKEKEWIRTPR